MSPAIIEEARQALLRCVSLPEEDKRAKRRNGNTKAVQMSDIISMLCTHNTATSTENTQNAINDNGDNLDDILRLAHYKVV